MDVTFICTSCRKPFTEEGPPTLCHCGHPLEVRCDWVENPLIADMVDRHIASLWRYRSVLPFIHDNYLTTLGEGWTSLNKFGDYQGVKLYLKDETRNPTGSFKDRGTAVMVEEEQIQSVQEKVAILSGTDPSPEVAVAWLGFEKLVENGWIVPREKVVIPVTGSGRRYAL